MRKSLDCCLCGSKKGVVLATPPGPDVIKCGGCGLIHQVSIPEDYGRVYVEGTEYHEQHQLEVGHEPYKKRYEHDHVIAQERIRKILGFRRSLDVGCANGAFVHAMSQLGFSAYGIEVNPEMRKYAGAGGAKILASYEDLYTQCGYVNFDIITYHDVFEHIADPIEELYKIGDHLRVDGVLVLDVPDGDTVFTENGAGRHHYRPDEHIWYWTQESLGGLLDKNGFRFLDVDRPIPGKLVIYITR